MIINNNQICDFTTNLANNFKTSEIYIPIKANFFIQKNFDTLSKRMKEIEQMYMIICKKYGQVNEEDGNVQVPPEKKEVFLQEYENLFSIEQDLDIKTIKLEDLGDIELTPAQMQAIMFMIED